MCPNGLEREMDLAAEKIGRSRTAALIRHMKKLNLRHRLKEFAREVRVRAHAGGSHEQFAGARAGQCDKVLYRAHRQGRMHDQHAGHEANR